MENAEKEQGPFAIIPVGLVKAGTHLVADGGFTCLRTGEVVEVRQAGGELYIMCSGDDSGEHFGAPDTDTRECEHGLDGQLDAEGENYVGFFRQLTEDELIAALRDDFDRSKAKRSGGGYEE